MSTFKWTLVVLAMFLVGLLALMFVDTASAETYSVYMVDAEGGLNVRTGPGTDYRVIFGLCDEAEVVLVDTVDNWALVNHRSLIGKREPFGWVCMDYLIKRYEVNIE
jgi:uncharacterized protein YgiM (DUF1202 family)